MYMYSLHVLYIFELYVYLRRLLGPSYIHCVYMYMYMYIVYASIYVVLCGVLYRLRILSFPCPYHISVIICH